MPFFREKYLPFTAPNVNPLGGHVLLPKDVRQGIIIVNEPKIEDAEWISQLVVCLSFSTSEGNIFYYKITCDQGV